MLILSVLLFYLGNDKNEFSGIFCVFESAIVVVSSICET